MILNCFVCSKKGNFRENNEDNLYINGRCLEINHSDISFKDRFKINNDTVIGVFDGLGGEQKGEIASYKAASALDNYREGIDFEEYFNGVNEELCLISNDKSKKIGSTAAILYLDNQGFVSANIGDSRVYLVRSNKINRLSLDHTIIETMINSGVIKREDANKSMYKNYLTRCLGMYGDTVNMAHITEKYEIKEGDIFILCSDGLSGVMDDDEILYCLNECDDKTNAALMLTDRAYEKGSRDNTTVIVIYCEYEDNSLFGRFRSKIGF